jgi:signal transduction histidine kinase
LSGEGELPASIRPDRGFLRGRRPECAWVAFVGAAVAMMLLAPGSQQVPFHLIWASLAVVYAVRLWPSRVAAGVVAAVGAVTAAAVLLGSEPAGVRVREAIEVPFMMVMVLAIVAVLQRRSPRAAERDAAERERDFVRDAAHQLRTPLTIARGHAELIRHAGPESQPAQDAAVVLRELQRLQRISDRLLILATAPHPGFLRLAPQALDELAEAAFARWTPVAERGWTLETPATGLVLVDRDRLDAALDALIENAILATSDGDAIAVRALDRDGVPVLAVSDGGAGVDPEHRERIFERFARFPTRSRSGHGGTGLGLPMARAIAEAHGATLQLADDAGASTTFELALAGFEPVEDRTHDARAMWPAA